MSMMHAAGVNDAAKATNVPPTASLMRWVIIATLPGIATMSYFFGLGVISNVLLAAAFGVALEAAVLRLRRRPICVTLNDSSALLTGVLLGASLPPASPWWLIGVGMVAAIVVAKQLYGGLGHNPFNPAMVGYTLLLVSFPTYMTLWAPPQELIPDGLWAQIAGTLPTAQLDSLSGATPLDAFKHKGDAVLASEFWATSPLSEGTLNAWRWVGLAWLAGGVLLLAKRIISWHIPVAMVGSLVVLATLFYLSDPSHFASPLFHLLTGATLFGAFFIATDPVSAATSRRGKLLYGVGIGALLITIRTFGGYPDAVAFAVLLMNLCVPLLDLYSVPRPTGQPKATSGKPGERL
ncbi:MULTISPECIES: RnfABCDGE type electron transport complex subunit D [unclassified Halomonas]|uniref:RnfABCDGE type electron transport complex subunit D n=1 Tax=unclassified Halomonas TaxID=2609666 RepID=UPI0007D97419|nr:MULTISPECIES: RnfABCDGE type electron transport complex subunit D [unclassified Halomonas]MBT2788118.1 RnfABCDGE type electron transport complex subunit D [Halomonas sp. ISL-106]MBT2795867.1 RnfABCDGE type electron transport complex subunit D [Halomonas sp. ISL-104]OAL61150.1 electron transport complex subunit RsxD [Halomonas sp. ALS9]